MLFIKLLFKNIFRFITGSSYRKFAFYAFKYGNYPRSKKKEIRINGKIISVPDTLAFIWQFYEIYVEEFYCFPTKNNQKPVIFDCGANMGLSCMYFKQKYPSSKILAFEADPEIANILKLNIENTDLKDVTLIPKAVWTHGDGIEIVSDGADGGSAFTEGTKIKVPSVRLRDWIDKESEIDMLKMDIEGAETDVLKDCGESLRKVKNLFVEFHSFRGQEQTLSDILKLLEELKFRYYILSPAIRKKPLIFQFEKKKQNIDLQVNIFAFNTINS